MLKDHADPTFLCKWAKTQPIAISNLHVYYDKSLFAETKQLQDI